MLWLWKFFLEKKQFSYVLVVALTVAGFFSLVSIGKEDTPAIDISTGVVSVVFPGASAADVEKLVTNKIEERISGLSNVDKVTSSSNEGVSVVTVQFSSNANSSIAIQDLRDAIAKAVPDLPTDVLTPTITKIVLSDRPIVSVTIAGDMPQIELYKLAKLASTELKSVSGVSKVDMSGLPDREVTVIVRKEALADYKLSLTGVMGAIAASNTALPAGSIRMNNVDYNVNFKGGLTDPSQVASIAVGNINGTPIYLRDIATISDSLAPAKSYSRLSLSGKPSLQAVTLLVYKQSTANINGVADAVKARVAELHKTLLKDVQVTAPRSTDLGIKVTKSLGDLTKTGFETVALVILVLLLTIGWRESVVAALSIPLSFLIAFIGLYATGNTLNFISLFALILGVGILVDSGIVVTEAIHTRMREKGNAMDAAYAALHDYAWPLIAGTMATVAVFAPLFFLSGIIGKFIAGIPYTLIFVLIASIFVALGIVPLIAILFTTTGEHNKFEQLQEVYTHRITEWYKSTLRSFLLQKRYHRLFFALLAFLFIGAISLPVIGVIPAIFFAQDNQEFVIVNIEMPRGTSLPKTDLKVREVEEVLYQDKDILSFETAVGRTSDLGGLGASGNSTTNVANITVDLPEGHRKTSSEVVLELQSKLDAIKDANVQVTQGNNGPASGAPVAIQFTGNNLENLITAADSGRQLLATIPHVKNINTTTKNNGTELNLSIDRAKAASLGVDTRTVAGTLRAAITGSKATSIPESDKDIDVVVKLNLNSDYTDSSNTNQTTLDTINNISIPTPAGGSVLLGSVLTSSLGISNGSIAHLDKKRIQTISAYIDKETTANKVTDQFQKELKANNILPPGVTVSYGGDTKEIADSFKQMFIALISGIVAMFMILIIAFNSIRYTGYLLIIVPLSLIGVLGGLALTGQPLSFSSILGVIALGGVIINHAIILMDSMIHLHRAHPEMSIVDVVVESAGIRLRPIVLTTITTAIGMVPLALSSALWGPLAYTIMFGLIFAMVLTLVLVPTLFYRHISRTEKKN